MKASYFGSMGYSERHTFPANWPVPPSYLDPKTSVQDYQDYHRRDTYTVMRPRLIRQPLRMKRRLCVCIEKRLLEG